MSKHRMTAGDRKAAIVLAALPLFARQGFAETTTKDLAKAAGVSEALLYRHFPSKEGLYLEIQNHCCQKTDPILRKLTEMEPSTCTLVQLVYVLMSSLIMGIPAGTIDWETRHRIMLNSFLEDGTFARLVYKNRFASYCEQMESCLEAAIAAGDAVKGPVTRGNRALFGHHLGAWLALVHLPEKPVIGYKVSKKELLHQAVWFALRGMGLTDKALATYYQPKKLARIF